MGRKQGEICKQQKNEGKNVCRPVAQAEAMGFQ